MPKIGATSASLSEKIKLLSDILREKVGDLIHTTFNAEFCYNCYNYSVSFLVVNFLP